MLTNKEAIHCSTEELANQVLRLLHNNGYEWNGGRSLTGNNNYEFYTSETCYCADDKLISYSPQVFFTKEGYTIITAEDFIKRSEEKIMKKEIIGYKLTKPEYKEAVEKILGGELKSYGEFNFRDGSTYHKLLKEAGVMDIWFEPVYKKEDKFHTINHGNGDSFQVKIVKDGFEFEASFVGRDYILHIVNNCNPSVQLPWNSKYSSIDIGCKKNIPISELEKLIK